MVVYPNEHPRQDAHFDLPYVCTDFVQRCTSDLRLRMSMHPVEMLVVAVTLWLLWRITSQLQQLIYLVQQWN